MTIQIPDEQAEVLKTIAAREGLTLEAWLGKLAGNATSGSRRKARRLEDLVAECDLSGPISDEDQAWLDAPAQGRERI
jgi:hypothetical protein